MSSSGTTPAPLELAGGSVTGRAHLNAGRCNQDAFGWSRRADDLVAVVCDGCGSGRHSEVGAKLGARLLLRAAARRLGAGLAPRALLAAARQEVLDHLRRLTRALGPGDEPIGATGAVSGIGSTVTEFFLFTVVGLLVDAGVATLFSLGDGLMRVNGQRHQLGPFPENEPPYLGYALLHRGLDVQIDRQLPLAELRWGLLGTDGALELEARGDRLDRLCTDERCFTNPDMVRRRLTCLAREPGGGLSDDTTLVIVRQRGARP